MAQKKGRKKPPANETKQEKFVRVVEPRVAKAIRVIGLVGNCAGAGYEYTGKQAGQIIEILLGAVSTLSDKFAKTTTSTGVFKLTKE